MRKFGWLVLMLALLTGCALGQPAGAGAPVAGEAADGAPEQQEAELSAVQTEHMVRQLADEDVLRAYEQAVKAWTWFELAPLPHAEAVQTAEGEVYYRVIDPRFRDVNALGNYLRTLFSAEIAAELLMTGGDVPLYRDVEGVLCTSGNGRQRDFSKDNIQVEITAADRARFQVDVTLDLLDGDMETVTGVESWSFPYEYREGRWVFTDFCLVY